MRKYLTKTHDKVIIMWCERISGKPDQLTMLETFSLVIGWRMLHIIVIRTYFITGAKMT